MWLREKVANEEKLRALFQQFVPATVAAKALGRTAEDILVGSRQRVTVLILNVRNFKLLMDGLPLAFEQAGAYIEETAQGDGAQ